MRATGRNRVTIDADVVAKHHGGPDGADRAGAAAAALRHAARHDVQAPTLIAHDGADLVVVAVPDATSGAALLATTPATVLHAVGAIARRIHALPPPPELPLPAAGPAAWVHGDLCPVNLLFGRDQVLRAVLDWEDTHVGDPLQDLVWTEWLVRTWHAHAIEALPVLYAAHGRRVPDADARRTAMRACLRRHRARQARAADWDRHLAALDDLDLTI